MGSSRSAYRSVPVIAAALLLSACGLYGEKGFSGREALTAARFVEEVDDRCREANEDLGVDVARLLGDGPRAAREPAEAIDDLRQVTFDLRRDLDPIYGPDHLEALRDRFQASLEAVGETLSDAKDAATTAPRRAAAGVREVKASLHDVEADLRKRGFRVCGMPRPSA